MWKEEPETDITPDCWVMLKIDVPDHVPIRKLLSGWYGGYLGADQWRLSSEVKEIADKNEYWEIRTHSGSTYRCGKKCNGLSSYTASKLARWQERLGKEAVQVLDGCV